MPHVVPSSTASPRTRPCPKNAVPQETGGAPAAHGASRTGGAPGHPPSPRTPPVPTHRTGAHPKSVRKHIASTQVQHGASRRAVLQPTVRAPVHCPCPGTIRSRQHHPGPHAEAVPMPTASAQHQTGTPAHAVPRQQNRGQALSTTSDPAEQRRAGDGGQRPLVPRSRCPPRLTPGVRPCGRETNPQDREAQQPPHNRDRLQPRRSTTDD